MSVKRWRVKWDETYPTPAEGWTCFHCGMHFGGNFKGWQEAFHHFGSDVQGDAWCQYTARQVRGLEDLLRSYQQEDTPRDRHLASIQAEHVTALRREEERGYARGMADVLAQRDEAVALLRDLTAYADGMSPIPPLITRARAFLASVCGPA